MTEYFEIASEILLVPDSTGSRNQAGSTGFTFTVSPSQSFRYDGSHLIDYFIPSLASTKLSIVWAFFTFNKDSARVKTKR
jgi:hypothetical protein